PVNDFWGSIIHFFVQFVSRTARHSLFKSHRHSRWFTEYNYINIKRMEHAASLLRGTGDYIQEITEQCGFLDINYFSHLFKRHYGLPPSKFRKASRGM
ncbi:MAG: helix-turn-helix transcriptional regulator, partial [Treponema sp.]|nr:helix-turn-helix transcriptional regulator [Treponema sp.]